MFVSFELSIAISGTAVPAEPWSKMIWNGPPLQVPVPFAHATSATPAPSSELTSVWKVASETSKLIPLTVFDGVEIENVPPVAPMISCCTSFGVRIADVPSLKLTLYGPPLHDAAPLSQATVVPAGMFPSPMTAEPTVATLAVNETTALWVPPL